MFYLIGNINWIDIWYLIYLWELAVKVIKCMNVGYWLYCFFFFRKDVEFSMYICKLEVWKVYINVISEGNDIFYYVKFKEKNFLMIR